MALNAGLIAIRKAAASKQGNETSNAKGKARPNTKATKASAPSTDSAGDQSSTESLAANAQKPLEPPPVRTSQQSIASTWSNAAEQAKSRLLAARQ